MEFEWDATKEFANLKKYGISFSMAIESFFDPKRGKVIRIIGSAEWRKFRRLYYETTENE